MNLSQAIVYFLREAFSSLVRSWKVSLVAITTITMSLFLSGVFLLVSSNLRQLIEGWEEEAKLVIYIEPDATTGEAERLQSHLRDAAWTSDVRHVTAEEAGVRFRKAFPSLGELLEGWSKSPIPSSLEVLLDRNTLPAPDQLDSWLDQLRQDSAVSVVDDDRDWLRQLEAVVYAIEALGMVLGALLLVTAVFTISSVIRLTAYLYRDEIAVMRLVGATEFFIRGPFYVEGVLQGLAGGIVAIVFLAAGHALLMERYADSALSLLTVKFLSLSELLALMALGSLAGLVGAIASLRRESLGQTAETPEWQEED